MQLLTLKEGTSAYLAQGAGSQTFLLLHNAGGSHEMMRPTTLHFSQKGRVLAPDLLGHGRSDAPHIDYTLSVFTNQLLQVCEQESVSRAVFIGLNYGANIGIEIAKRFPHLFSHLVLIEPPIFMEPWIRKVVEDQIHNLTHSPKEPAQEKLDSIILKASDEERHKAFKIFRKTPSFVKASLYQHLLLWDRQHSFQCSLPTLLIQTSEPFCEEEKARRVFPHLQVGRVVGSGPWANLEVPSQVHAMIDRYLEIA